MFRQLDSSRALKTSVIRNLHFRDRQHLAEEIFISRRKSLPTF